MPDFPTTSTWQRFMLVWGSLVLVIASLYWAQSVLIPVVLAILFTFILAPLVNFLHRRGLGRVLSVIIVVGFSFSFLAGLLLVVLLQVQSLAVELPQHKDEIIQKIETVRQSGKGSWLDKVQETYQEINQRLESQSRLRNPEPAPVPVRVEQSGVPAFLQTVANPAAEVLVSGGLVLILVIFMLIQREALRNRIIRLWGPGSLTNTTRAMDDAGRRISRFLLMQLIVNVTYGIALAFGLYFIGVPYSILWGFLAATLRYIPYLGAWLAAILPLALSVAISPGWTQPILIVALILVLELLSNNVMEPMLYGQSTGMSEVALLVAAAFWAWLWGPIGLVLSTPLTACLVVLGRYVPQLEFLNILLGDEAVLEPAVSYFQRLLARDEYEATDLIQDYAQAHSAAEAFDSVLLPALVLTRNGRERHELTAEDEKFIFQETREAIEELAPAAVEPADPEAAPVLVIGCPAQDEADELALHMFGSLLDPGKCRLEVISSKMLFSEMVKRVTDTPAGLVVIGTVPPGGAAQTRYLCKRLRRQFPDLKILVGCWGLQDHLTQAKKYFASGGADAVGTSLSESRKQLTPLISVLAHAPGSREKEVVAAGGN